MRSIAALVFLSTALFLPAPAGAEEAVWLAGDMVQVVAHRTGLSLILVLALFQALQSQALLLRRVFLAAWRVHRLWRLGRRFLRHSASHRPPEPCVRRTSCGPILTDWSGGQRMRVFTTLPQEDLRKVAQAARAIEAEGYDGVASMEKRISASWLSR
jgi:hypothetical protein